MSTAFQASAFQHSAFQITADPPPTGGGLSGGGMFVFANEDRAQHEAELAQIRKTLLDEIDTLEFLEIV